MNFTLAQANLEGQGFHLEKKFFSSQAISGLTKTAEEFDQFRQKTFQSLVNPHSTSTVFLDAFRNPDTLAFLRHYFSGPVSGVQTQYFYGPSGREGYTKHQDNFFIQADPRYFISVWTALDPADTENGCLVMYPKSHLLGLLPVSETPTENRGLGQDPNANRLEAQLSENFEAINVCMEPGDTVFIHANVVHSSHPNRSVRTRRSLLCTYIRTGQAFREGNYAKRKELPFP